MKPQLLLIACLLPLAGCLNAPTSCPNTNEPCTLYQDAGFDGTTWPDLTGHEIVILDHGAFDWAFGAAKPIFENLTGAKVTNVPADDAGTALQLAIQDHRAGGGSFDILYGIDNVLMYKALEADIFEPYTPLLGDRISPEHIFVTGEEWPATPVDFGYIAVNGDPRAGITLEFMEDLVDNADSFVTMDPRFSSPGLGFLIATVANFGEVRYLDFWQDLFEGGVTVTQGWTEGYTQHFTGGYGQWNDGFSGDKALVTSYSTSPAYEMYWGYDVQNDVLLAPQSTFKQVQTMGILRGADRLAAEAWIEFTLTDEFQSLAAEYNAIYPVVSNPTTQASVNAVYGNLDPTPGSFEPARISTQMLGPEVDTWVADWVDLYEAHQA